MSWNPLVYSVLFAAFGGLAFKLLELAELRNVPKSQRPDLKDPIYWLPFLIGPIVGGALAVAYGYPDDPLKPLVAVNVGVSAPLILRSMAAINPLDTNGIDPGDGA